MYGRPLRFRRSGGGPAAALRRARAPGTGRTVDEGGEGQERRSASERRLAESMTA
ncbi:hypothetical protein SHIRM173S_02731 [Streptomyces hirsutus]